MEKLAIKLWETLIEKGLGSLVQPGHIRRIGRAQNEVRREELLMLAQAEVDVADVKAGRKRLRSDGTLMPSGIDQTNPIDTRIEPTLGVPNVLTAAVTTNAINAARMEINSAKAIIFAEDQLANDPHDLPTRDIDEDWLYAWRDYAGKVSDEDLQRLWGRVLAGEFKSPGKYSIRTLEFLKTLSKSEAVLISKMAQYVINGYIARSQENYLNERGLTFENLFQLEGMGVVSGVVSSSLRDSNNSLSNRNFVRTLICNGKALVVEHDDPVKEFELDVYALTEVGSQLLGLGSFEPDLEYLRLVGKEIVKEGFSVQLCDWPEGSKLSGRPLNCERIDE